MFVWIEGRTSMRRTTLTLAALAVGMVLAGTGGARGQPHASGMSPERLERVTAVLDKYIDAGVLAGAVSLIYRHGEIAHLRARGFRDADARTPMQRDTIFGSASMTKPITAVATMMLVEEGKIRLDVPVDRWLPELADRQVLRGVMDVVERPHGVRTYELRAWARRWNPHRSGSFRRTPRGGGAPNQLVRPTHRPGS